MRSIENNRSDKNRQKKYPKLMLSVFLLASQIFSLSACGSLNSTSSKVATTKFTTASENFIYNEFYQIQNQDHVSDINLLKFDRIEKQFPLPTVKYNRKRHFGGWIHFANDMSCLDTRGLVLQRDSVKPVTVSNCRVIAGDWFDPYTDQKYILASMIQIDHVVPLKHAYMTGAFEWDNKKRCQYANYLGNSFHLLSVNGIENMRKGDNSPLEYLPPNQKFTCQYIKDWLEIKYIWSLRLTPKEQARILEIVSREKCLPKDFLIPVSYTHLTLPTKRIV